MPAAPVFELALVRIRGSAISRAGRKLKANALHSCSRPASAVNTSQCG